MGTGMLFNVPDMECEHCKKTIESEIRKLSGIENVNINLKTKEVEVIGRVTKEEIISAIKSAGYSIEEEIKGWENRFTYYWYSQSNYRMTF